MMHNSDPLPLSPFNHSSCTKMKERSAFNQAMALKASSMQRIIQVVHRVAQKSCRQAFQLFCCPFGAMLQEKAHWTCCPAQNHQTTEVKTSQVALHGPPSTILIVNISNSTLIDCVIGNNTFPSVVAESQPLMQESELQMYNQARCSCSHGQQGEAQSCPPPLAEPPSLSIHSSHLNCVIIGDNNYMHAEQTHSSEIEELQA
ncbi:uncharacterized protein si:dkey-29h14.10 [Chelmon rostratus]|uniref:uncharacterized protein si:dkey-29h14.10 n=1 Tax=Chelmon rostratus TaxID=109905 RepID=UPI001BE5AB26|nr:uncharacterized protein si:dkey-29h14.10 [Chelmon rostratus]